MDDRLRGQVRYDTTLDAAVGLPRRWMGWWPKGCVIEPRMGGVWCELAHDRLVAPVVG
ncbi:MAG: hypothetical protein R2854_11040 [Caldilineaceae bacterium]